MQSDFSQGKVWKNVINQAIPLMVAQLIQILYNVVDRIYIGHLPVIGSEVAYEAFYAVAATATPQRAG